MSSEIIKVLEERVLKDFQSSITLEKKYEKELQSMQKLGLGQSNGYLKVLEEKITISYFAAYLYRLFDYFRTLDENVLRNISPNEMRIKRMLQMWKKNDINAVRKMRKGVGNGGVDLMKRSVTTGISRVNEYIEYLGNEIKDL